MITDLNKIIAEWSFRTKSGILDAKSMSHQIILEELLKEYGWPLEARAELVNNLMEAPKDREFYEPDDTAKKEIEDKGWKRISNTNGYSKDGKNPPIRVLDKSGKLKSPEAKGDGPQNDTKE